MFKKYYIYLLLIAGFLGCKKNELPTNTIFLVPDALSNANTSTLSIDSAGATYTVSARTSNILTSDVQVTYGISEDALKQYNIANGTNYKVLPTQYYSFSATNAQIAKGTVAAAPVSLLVKSYKDLPDTNQYVIPITIESIAGADVPVLEPSRTLFLILKKIIYTTVPLLGGTQPMSVTYKIPFNNLTNWTFEWRVNMSALDANNQALISSGDVYTRFGDVVIRQTQLQIKTASTQFSPGDDFQANIWYNFALTYDGANLKWYRDGNLIMTQSVNAVYNFSGISFGGGGGGVGTSKPRMANEIRFWTVTRSQSQILNNLYGVNPSTPGLAGYWKCNEGSGNIFKDVTANGNDMTASGAVQWVLNVRMPPN